MSNFNSKHYSNTIQFPPFPFELQKYLNITKNTNSKSFLELKSNEINRTNTMIQNINSNNLSKKNIHSKTDKKINHTSDQDLKSQTFFIQIPPQGLQIIPLPSKSHIQKEKTVSHISQKTTKNISKKQTNTQPKSIPTSININKNLNQQSNISHKKSPSIKDPIIQKIKTKINLLLTAWKKNAPTQIQEELEILFNISDSLSIKEQLSNQTDKLHTLLKNNSSNKTINYHLSETIKLLEITSFNKTSKIKEPAQKLQTILKIPILLEKIPHKLEKFLNQNSTKMNFSIFSKKFTVYFTEQIDKYFSGLTRENFSTIYQELSNYLMFLNQKIKLNKELNAYMLLNIINSSQLIEFLQNYNITNSQELSQLEKLFITDQGSNITEIIIKKIKNSPEIMELLNIFIFFSDIGNFNPLNYLDKMSKFNANGKVFLTQYIKENSNIFVHEKLSPSLQSMFSKEDIQAMLIAIQKAPKIINNIRNGINSKLWLSKITGMPELFELFKSNNKRQIFFETLSLFLLIDSIVKNNLSLEDSNFYLNISYDLENLITQNIQDQNFSKMNAIKLIPTIHPELSEDESIQENFNSRLKAILKNTNLNHQTLLDDFQTFLLTEFPDQEAQEIFNKIKLFFATTLNLKNFETFLKSLIINSNLNDFSKSGIQNFIKLIDHINSIRENLIKKNKLAKNGFIDIFIKESFKLEDQDFITYIQSSETKINPKTQNITIII